MRQYWSTLASALGCVDELAYRGDELVDCFGREGRFTVYGANPGVYVGDANRDTIVTVFEGCWTPLFGNVMLATDRSRFSAHSTFCVCACYRVDVPILFRQVADRDFEQLYAVIKRVANG